MKYGQQNRALFYNGYENGSKCKKDVSGGATTMSLHVQMALD